MSPISSISSRNVPHPAAPSPRPERAGSGSACTPASPLCTSASRALSRPASAVARAAIGPGWPARAALALPTNPHTAPAPWLPWRQGQGDRRWPVEQMPCVRDDHALHPADLARTPVRASAWRSLCWRQFSGCAVQRRGVPRRPPDNPIAPHVRRASHAAPPPRAAGGRRAAGAAGEWGAHGRWPRAAIAFPSRLLQELRERFLLRVDQDMARRSPRGASRGAQVTVTNVVTSPGRAQ